MIPKLQVGGSRPVELFSNRRRIISDDGFPNILCILRCPTDRGSLIYSEGHRTPNIESGNCQS